MSPLEIEQLTLCQWLTERFATETQVPGPLRILCLTHLDTWTKHGGGAEILSFKDTEQRWWEPERLAECFLAHAWLHACSREGPQRYAIQGAYFPTSRGGARPSVRYTFQLVGVQMPRPRVMEEAS
jgi:hypothetical protein